MKQTVCKRTAAAYLNKVQSPALLANADKRERVGAAHEENKFVCIMESYRKGLIFQQVSAQFNISVLKKKYYCPGVSYFTFRDKLISYHRENIEIFFRVDHVVVRHSFTKEITVYLLTSHLTGKCSAFLTD